jgi:hypothetical protein
MTSLGDVKHTAPGHEPGLRNARTPTQSAAFLSAEAADDAPTSPASCAPQAPLCGVTRRTGRIEWVCVRPVHDTGSKNRGRQVTGYYPQSERHYFVRKYPGRVP